MQDLTNKKRLGLNKPKINESLILILTLGLIFRVVAGLVYEGFSSDIALFKYWAENAASNLTGIYRSDIFLDYPPFYIYFLFLIGKVAKIFNISYNSPLMLLLVKMPSIIADLTTGYILYRISKDKLSENWRLLIASLYIFNPAVLINSSIWGQVDSFLTMLLALGFVFLFTKRPYISSIFFAAAILTKPQGLIVMPVVLFEYLRRRDFKLLLKALGVGLGTAILIILPFSFNQHPLWIVDLYFNTASGYKYASLNAFNFFSLIGSNLADDSLPFLFLDYKTWGYIFIAGVVVYSTVLYYKGKGRHLSLMAALVLIVGVFVFSVRMHERYMFPALYFLLAIFILKKDKRCLLLYAVSSITIFVNTYVVLIRMMRDNYPHVPPNDPVLFFISLINVVVCIFIFIWSWRSCVSQSHEDVIEDKWIMTDDKLLSGKSDRSRWSNDKKATDDIPSALKLVKKDAVIMTVMTAVYLIIALINLGGFKAPETFWAPEKESDGFILELESEEYVSRVTIYGGLGKGSFDVSFQNEHGVFEVAKTVDIGTNEFYKWLIVDIHSNTQRIKVDTVTQGGAINEVAVYGQSIEEPLDVKVLDLDWKPVNEGKLLHLTDEQGAASYRDSYLTSTYFDEIYHARTAYEHLNAIKPYEWTHPPLGKLIISLGILSFGMNPFGWRIAGTLIGAAMIPVVYIFGKRLFGKSFYAFCAAFLMMFDFMHFAQTRIATIDSFTTFFVMISYYFMADYYLSKSYERGFKKSLKPLFLSGLFFGLGAATKWSAIYGAPGLAFIFLLSKYNEYKEYRRLNAVGGKAEKVHWLKDFWPLYINRTILYCVLFFIIIPAAIYLVSFIPYLFVPGMTIGDIFEYQKQMYSYHSNLNAEHFFSSEWWTWPLIIKPIWYFSGADLPEGMASTISSFGNPAIWWIGIGTFFFALWRAFKGNKPMVLATTAIISQYIPWMIFISRIAFIYHFFPMVPFVILTIVYYIKEIRDRKWSRNLIYGYLGIVALLFIIFYPAISGLVVSKKYIEALRWFSTWYF